MIKTLVYVGMYMGKNFDEYVDQFDRCFGFEANPDLAASLAQKYKHLSHVTIIHAAATTYDGTIQLNISSNQGGSSSVGNFSSEWPNFAKGEIYMDRSVEVPAVNLFNYLQEKKVEVIDEYVSDMQGMDLEVLKTLQPYLAQRRIKRISCEVAKDEHGNIYDDLPDNSEEGFNKLLAENYEMSAKGWGVLTEGGFEGVPETWWEMDCMWQLKAV